MAWVNVGTLIYPIGSVYITEDAATSPAELFGGSWNRIDGGLCLTSIGDYSWTNYDLTDSNGALLATKGGEIGGRANIATNQMPAHEGHLLSNTSNNGLGNYAAYLKNSVLTSYGSSGRGWNLHNSDECTPAGQTLGGTAAYIPKHVGVYAWKRVA